MSPHIAYDALALERDYRRSVAETRALEAGTDRVGRQGPAATGLPDAIRGGVAVVGAAIFTEPTSYDSWGSVPVQSVASYGTPQEAHDAAKMQLEWYQEMASQLDTVRLILTRDDLDSVLATWAEDADPSQRQQGWILLMEGADPILEPSQFGEWWQRGLRILGTSWTKTRYAGGTNAPGPLTDLGRALLAEMAKVNALLDITHMSEEACLESLHTYEGPIFGSHVNPRQFSNTDRHLTDEAIRLLARRDGVMGLVLLNVFWTQDWQQGNNVPLSRVIDAVDTICQLTGSARHVGIGTDWYGGMGSNLIPNELDTVADLWKIGAGLRDRGYGETDVEAILSGNMLRKFREALPE